MNLDWLITQDITRSRPDSVIGIMKVLTGLGNWQVVGGISLVLMMWFWVKRREYFWAILLTDLSVVAVEIGIKAIFGRQRPPEVLALIIQGGYSFPSGHSYIATAFWGLLVYIAVKLIRSDEMDKVVEVVGIGVIGGIAISRIYLGVHWTSDVLAGLILGLGWLWGITRWVEILEKRDYFGKENPEANNGHQKRRK